MARGQIPFYTLNAGEVDAATVNRIDLEKLRMAGESMINWFPTTRGPMTMRPGTKYIGRTHQSEKARLLPFIFNASTASLLEVSGESIRVWNDDELVSYDDYDTTIQNGSFNSFTGWVNDCSPASVPIATVGVVSGELVLKATTYSFARAYQTISVSDADQEKLHCLRIRVSRGPVTFRIGKTVRGTEIIEDQILETGTHFIAFYPKASQIIVEFEANGDGRINRKVAACVFVKNDNLRMPSPWAENDLRDIRYAQSGSIVFAACKGYRPYKIERRGPNSWGIVEYIPSSGPYLPYNSDKIRLKASGTLGGVRLTSDQPFFRRGMVGALFQITHDRQMKKEIFTASDQTSGWIKVTGVGITDRQFTLEADFEVGSGTIVVERSFGTPDNWKPASLETLISRTGGSNTQFDETVTGSFGPTRVTDVDYAFETDKEQDNLDNQIVYYRWRASSITDGSKITATISARSGTGQTGVVRITDYDSPTQVNAQVISQLGAQNLYTDDWREGAWSDAQSWPSSVEFHDGRIWWAGLDKVYGSISDEYYNFDPTREGDAGPIVRSIALGPVEGIHWMLSTQRLLVGTASAAVSIRSNTIDEPITPTKFTAKNASTVGCASIQGVAMDSSGIFVQRNKTKVHELAYDVQINDYGATELTRLNQEVCKPGIVEMAVQRQPDSRVYFVKSDGEMAVLLYDKDDQVAGWSRYRTKGDVESICVLPNGREEDVYLVVRRKVAGEDKRLIEKFASTADTAEGKGNWLMDSTVRWSSDVATDLIDTKVGHLAGQEVIVYAKTGAFEADAFDEDAYNTDNSLIVERYTVSDEGTIELDAPLTKAFIGLPYLARFKSVKLAYASQAGTALTQKKRVNHLAMVGIYTAFDGLQIGRKFTDLMDMSKIYKGREIDPFEVFEDWDYDASAFPGRWDSDSRVCIENVSPYPATISGLVISMETNDRG